MKKTTNCLLLVVALSLVLATISCQPVKPMQTEDIEPAFELRVDMLGDSYTLLLDSEGRLIAGVNLASADGAVILSIAGDTGLLDKDGEPLSFISVELSQEKLPAPEGAIIVSAVYSLGPQDAVFDPPLKLTLSYDSKKLSEEIRESDVHILPYYDGDGWGSSYYKMVDTEHDRVTTLISHFTRYAVLAPVVVSQPIAPNVPQDLDVLEVVYFHRPQRCSGCVYAETGTRFTLENYFASELAEGKIIFKVINLGDETNTAIVERYGAYTSSLFINSIRDGADHIEEVMDIWLVLGNDREFIAIVKDKIESCLGEK